MGTMTILFVDQVGSTRQLSTLGDHSAIEIRDDLHAEMALLLREFAGTFHSDTGDGFMASFDSSVNAVECALVAARGDDRPQCHAPARTTSGPAHGGAHR